MCALTVVILLVADLSGVVANVERRTVTRLMAWAKNAESAGLQATARRIYERVLEFDPDQGLARGKLGFRRVKGTWQPDEARQHEVNARKDGKDTALAKRYREALALLEEEHLAEVVRVCGKYGTLEEKRAMLLPLLATRPRRIDIHEALRHRRIGDDYVRPELVAMVKLVPQRMKAWRATRSPEVGESAFTDAIPGVADLKFLRVGGCDVASNAASKDVVPIVGRTQAVLGMLLGKRVWKRSPVVFLAPAAYTAMVKALHSEPDKQRLYGRFGDYLSPDFYAIRVHQVADAGERYAHAAGHMTMNDLTKRVYPWLAEGFGYFLSLELYDRGNVSFVSLTASSRKIRFTRPPPASKTRDGCNDWLREQMIAGHAYSLQDVCARSLNNLDFCASMEAYSFVRFLFLYNPDAMRKLPATLGKQEGGSQVGRSDRALRAAFGKGISDLEPLWRAFVLEITAK